MTDEQTQNEPRRSTLLGADVPAWGAAPATAAPTAPVPTAAPAWATAAGATRPAAEPNRAALARVAVSNAALAWIKAELRTESRMAELRSRTEEALALGVQRDVLLGLVVDACRRHGGTPGMLGEDILVALGVELPADTDVTK
ncbi:hypothetical protein [Nocardia mangyaensis]|uniref:hypothetical protein n=1 Tax=Nocardia mangyaensis TaxID=2213200 RepID=UPI002675D404|nr:hypothetical protein [Nocardia mangyaensis]MDO3651161.1 hypothetical protein [Nocardia mangyaensis]